VATFEVNRPGNTVRNNSQVIRFGRLHQRRQPGFRKACRTRFLAYPLKVQTPLGKPRTCFEGPFGEVLRKTGSMANACPFRFSTKYQDDETDLLYYGYRYYNASTGRWLSRDPIEEAGGSNLYSFVADDPLEPV